MESIDILTGQHITIKYESASIVKRMLALLLDYLFIGVYVLTWFFILFHGAEKITQQNSTLIIVICFLYLPALCYHLIFETFMNGQTPGKLILKIRVTNIDGSAPNFVSYFLRWILMIIDFFPYGGIGALLIIFTKNHQRLGDLAAGTTVVRTTPSSAKYKFDNIFNESPDNYKPVFPEVVELTDGQINFISELLENKTNEITPRRVYLTTHAIQQGSPTRYHDPFSNSTSVLYFSPTSPSTRCATGPTKYQVISWLKFLVLSLP